jgi:4-carboxymuconolactone decarboxylase
MTERESLRLERILAEHGQRWQIERDGLVWRATEHPSPTALHHIVAYDLEALEQKIIQAELSGASPGTRAASFQETLRRLAIIDEGFVEDQAGLGLGLPASQLLNPKTATLVRVGALAAIGSPGVCLEWSTTRALAAGATEDEIIGVLLAIAPVAGIGRVVGAVPGVAAGLGYDIEAALMDPDDH